MIVGFVVFKWLAGVTDLDFACRFGLILIVTAVKVCVITVYSVYSFECCCVVEKIRKYKNAL